MGYEVILVSSGVIAVGSNKLNMKTRPTSMRMKQASAAVGQCSIMFLYDKFFGDYDKTIAQILLNAEDMEQEEKKENLINTFDALLEPTEQILLSQMTKILNRFMILSKEAELGHCLSERRADETLLL